MGERLRASLRDAPVVRKDGYDYLVHPLTDGVPALDPALLKEAVDGILDVVDLEGADALVTAEAMGLPVGTALSLRTGLPLTVVRKRSYGLPGEIRVDQSTGYDQGELFLNGLHGGERVVVVDDVVSTGGTLAALLDALEDAGAVVQDVVVVLGKGDGRARLEERYDRSIKVLQRVEVRDGDVVPVPPEG